MFGSFRSTGFFRKLSSFIGPLLSKNKTEIKTQINSVYKRTLPPTLIQLNSPCGKKIFVESLNEGNMECFFPLIEQFSTQYLPSTCGTTTLSMVLNALGIDPKINWKGIWRWYSEETLGCSHPDYLKEIDIEKFAHLAKRNNTSLQIFYHQSVKKSDGFNVSMINCPTGQHKCTSIIKKSARFDTFFDCCVASCRRDGFFLIVNHSRKALNQTGFGHFSPIGGLNLNKKLLLSLDVARYKYPPHWCDIKKMYDSLEELDTATGNPRGFCLITKSYQNYARICRETEDFLSLNQIKQKLKSFKYVEEGKNDWELIKDIFTKILIHFKDDFRYLLVHYLFELSIRIDPDQAPHVHEEQTLDNGYGEKYLENLKNQFRCLKINSCCQELIKIMLEDKELSKIVSLIQDFHPYLCEEIIGILIFSMPWESNEIKGIFKGKEALIKELREYEIIKSSIRYIEKEVENLRLNLGFDGLNPDF